MTLLYINKHFVVHIFFLFPRVDSMKGQGQQYYAGWGDKRGKYTTREMATHEKFFNHRQIFLNACCKVNYTRGCRVKKLSQIPIFEICRAPFFLGGGILIKSQLIHYGVVFGVLNQISAFTKLGQLNYEE